MMALLGWTERGDLVLLVLIVAICVLLVLGVFLAAYTLWMRQHHNDYATRMSELEAIWTPKLLSCIESDAPLDELWAEVHNGDELAFVRFIGRHVRRISGAERTVLRQAVEPYLDALAARIDLGSIEERALIVQTLGELGLPAHGATVVSALSDPSPLVNMVAARSLARREYPEYAQDILEHLPRLSSWSRGFLAAMLAGMGPDAAPALRRVLADPQEQVWKRAVVTDALRWLNDVEAVPVALAVLEEGPSRDLMAQILRLLARLADDSAAPHVRRLLTADDFVVRAGAIQTLGRIGRGADDRRALVAAMDDPSPWVSTQAARALARLGEESTLEVVAESDGMKSVVAQYVMSQEVDWQWT